MSLSSKLGTSLAVAALAMSLSSCGSGDDDKSGAGDKPDAGAEFAAQTVKEITAQSEKDMKALTSLTMAGTITQDDGELELDLSFDTDGNCAGSMGMQGGTAEVVSVDGASYLRGNEAFWRATAGDSAEQVMAVLGDRWAKLPAGSEDFSEFCDLDSLLDEFDDDSDDSKETVTKGKVATVDGQDAVEIVTKDEDGTTHAWVATEGKHYIIKLEHTGEDEPGVMSFSDFDEPVDAEAPAEDEVVDMSDLGG